MVIINSFRQPESPIRCEQKNVRALLDKQDLGVGSLYVSERTLCWEGPRDNGFAINYENISLHAISKDANLYPKDCVYVMIDGEMSLPGQIREPENNDVDSDEEEARNSEIILVPEDNPNLVSNIYEAIKVCQELNPDPCDVDDDDDDEDDHLYEDAEEMQNDYEPIQHRGGGDADIEDISRRIQRQVDINYVTNGNSNDDEDFEDAD